MLKNPHKQAVDYIFDELLINRGLENYDTYLAQNLKVHFPKGLEIMHQTELVGRHTAKELEQKYIDSFRYERVQKCDLMICDDKAVVRWKIKGNHCGDFFKLKATHKNFTATGQTIFSLNAHNQIDEVWQSWDVLGLLNEIGYELKPTSFDTQKSFEKLSKLASLLTKRERECLKCLIEGLTAKQIGESFSISFRTVEFHFENIKNKLSCSNRQELFRLARLFERHHILD